MHANHRRRLALGSILTSTAVLASFFAAVGPAQAYGNLTVKYALVDTDDYRVIRGAGNLRVDAQSTRCVLPDSADGTFFQKDAGGVAIKIELHDGSGMVAKQEFHPYGEHLWVYDTRNDSDTVYTELWWDHQFNESYAPPGTSARVEYRHVNLSFAEGTPMSIHDWDNFPLEDSIVFISGGRA